MARVRDEAAGHSYEWHWLWLYFLDPRTEENYLRSELLANGREERKKTAYLYVTGSMGIILGIVFMVFFIDGRIFVGPGVAMSCSLLPFTFAVVSWN